MVMRLPMLCSEENKMDAYLGKKVDIVFKNGLETIGIISSLGDGLFSIDGDSPVIFQSSAVDEIRYLTASKNGQLAWF